MFLYRLFSALTLVLNCVVVYAFRLLYLSNGSILYIVWFAMTAMNSVGTVLSLSCSLPYIYIFNNLCVFTLHRNVHGMQFDRVDEKGGKMDKNTLSVRMKRVKNSAPKCAVFYFIVCDSYG